MLSRQREVVSHITKLFPTSVTDRHENGYLETGVEIRTDESKTVIAKSIEGRTFNTRCLNTVISSLPSSPQGGKTVENGKSLSLSGTYKKEKDSSSSNWTQSNSDLPTCSESSQLSTCLSGVVASKKSQNVRNGGQQTATSTEGDRFYGLHTNGQSDVFKLQSVTLPGSEMLDCKCCAAAVPGIFTATTALRSQKITSSSAIFCMDSGTVYSTVVSTKASLTNDPDETMVSSSRQVCCESRRESQGEMSGLSPAIPSSSSQGICAEVHQLNYRISTSVMETKCGNGSLEFSTLSANNDSGIKLEDQNNFNLPSSVYGTSASNIETKLIGLHLSNNEKLTTIGSSPLISIKNNFLQNILENPSVADKSGDAVKFDGVFDKAEQILTHESKNSSDLPKIQENETAFKDRDTAQTGLNKVLKLHIPDLSVSTDSDSSQQAFPEPTKTKMPKITSPQILEQHISKIISENAAIVETLDPLWSRRYQKQSNSVNGQEIEAKKLFIHSKARRFSEDRLASNAVSSDKISQSKLQAALLGGFDSDSQHCSQSQPASTPNTLFPSSFSFSSESSSPVPFNRPILPSVVLAPKSGNDIISEEELRGSAVRSLIGLKQARGSISDGSPFFGKDSYNHPQNPEGSIIKDLLLKSKSKNRNNSLTEFAEEKNVSSKTTSESSKDTANLSPSFLYQCTGCKLSFRTKDQINEHVASCSAQSKFHVRDHYESRNPPPEKLVRIKSASYEKLENIHSGVNFSFTQNNNTEGLFANEAKTAENPCDSIGHILKKQLLSPLSKRKETSSKKRKISEPVFSISKQESSLYHSQDAGQIEKTDIFSPQHLDAITLSPHRCRSQSVHLFGGEVQILDGVQTKKMKITTNFQGAFTPTSSSLGSNQSFGKLSPSDFDPNVNNFASLPTVVVTIAQPVHNSGGTVTHLSTLSPLPPLSPVVTISNHLMTSDIEKLSVIRSSPPKNLSLLSCEQNSPTFPLLAVELMKKSKSDRLTQSTNSITALNDTAEKSLLLPTELCIASSPSLQNLHLSGISASCNTPAVKSVSDCDFSSKSFSVSDHIPIVSVEESTDMCITSSPASTICHTIPTVTFTPSSPIHPSSSDMESIAVENSGEEENTKKFLAPARPTSLPLKKKPFTMVGSTLVSPETPRPKKSCIQLYLNGHAYTYLGLKCSTRSTYCCIYRPQPMYVPQDTNPKLSMYSNWQVVPAKEELCGMTPGQMMVYYNSRHGLRCSKSTYTMAKLSEPLSFTHSSYWVFRSQEEHDKQESPQEPFSEPQNESDKSAASQVSSVGYSSEKSQNASMEHDNVSDHFRLSTVESDNQIKSKEDTIPTSSDECSYPAEGSSVLSGVEENGTFDEEEDDDDAQDDGTGSQTDSSLPQPPKRVKIFEGGFKSNEDYTYVRGRGRGKYVCEECGIRCKKPSMLKKHIRTHTDLRPYKCRHCSFAFKTKGNLTKHMKSKAHHKKCTELGIIPVPTTTDDSQIDEEALAKQEQLERKNPQFSDGEDADDDEDDEMDDDCEDSDGLDDDCGSDSGSMATNQNTRSTTNGHSRKFSSWENVTVEQFDDNGSGQCDTPSQRTVEQEAARSLLHLSALSEPSQWPASTGDMTDQSSSSGETKIISPSPTAPSLSAQPVASELLLSIPTTSVPSTDVKMSTDQSSQLWIAPEPMGHRPRSYSADIPFSGLREQHNKVHMRSDSSQKVAESPVKDSFEMGTKEHYGRRYSISVAREARRPARILQAPNWGNSDLSSSVLNKWPELDVSDQPMDLTVSRNSGSEEKSKLQFCPIALVASPTVIATTMPQGNVTETHIQLSSEENLGEQLRSKSLPVLSPHIMNEYDGGGENSGSDAGITISDDQSSFSAGTDPSSFCTNTDPTSFCPSADQPSFGASTSQSSFLYIPDINLTDAQLSRKEMDTIDDQHSPEVPDYTACSPITPPPQEENSTYYYPSEGFTGSSVANSMDEMHSAPRSHAEFIVPSTSTNMEEGRCICRICNKVFNKSSQLRLHVNIHYFERPFRCDNCAVSFRTKGHLQKHKRSVSHYNKVNMNMTFGTPTVDNPRPFKCADCKIAFRIHGHLAKHLRSKMHIMKLECLGKLPFGMYAEMERSGVSLNEIDTTDCNNSLESLQVMAQRLYQRDPRRMRWHNPDQVPTEIESAKSTSSLPAMTDALVLPEQHSVVSVSSPSAVSIPTPSAINSNQNSGTGGEVKQEPSDLDIFRAASTFSDSESPISPPLQVDSNASLHRSGTCHICGRLFKSAKFLQVHLYCDHASINPTPVDKISSQTAANNPGHPSVVAQDLSCDLCGKIFPNQSSLQQHLLSHAQPRPFVCEICDAGFTSSSLLVAHLATHQQINSSGCSESGLVQLR